MARVGGRGLVPGSVPGSAPGVVICIICMTTLRRCDELMNG